MSMAFDAAAVWMELLGDTEGLIGIGVRVAFIVCALLAVAKLLELMLSKPTHDERHFWHRRR